MHRDQRKLEESIHLNKDPLQSNLKDLHKIFKIKLLPDFNRLNSKLNNQESLLGTDKFQEIDYH